jgi:hypothetical protein
MTSCIINFQRRHRGKRRPQIASQGAQRSPKPEENGQLSTPNSEHEVESSSEQTE